MNHIEIDKKKFVLSDELTLEEIHKAGLETLIALRNICDELGLKYWLFYGSLIGAIRHQGFIPWDDDIDIIMPREDYEKLVQFCIERENEIIPYKIIHYLNNRDYIYPLARFSDSRYHVDYKGTKEYSLGIFVDIYPVDGCGKSYKKAAKLIQRYNFIKKIIFTTGLNHSPGKSKNIAHDIVWKLFYCFGNIVGIRKLIKNADVSAKRLSFEESDYVVPLCWNTYGAKEILKKEYFNHTIEVVFEGNMFKAPQQYDEILRKIYGDYMQMPPVEKRYGHHEYKAYRILEDKGNTELCQ